MRRNPEKAESIHEIMDSNYSGRKALKNRTNKLRTLTTEEGETFVELLNKLLDKHTALQISGRFGKASEFPVLIIKQEILDLMD